MKSDIVELSKLGIAGVAVSGLIYCFNRVLDMMFQMKEILERQTDALEVIAKIYQG